MLDAAVAARGCDHSRRLTRTWLEENDLPVEATLAWLDDQSGFCDCEIVYNAAQRFDEAMKDA